MSGNSLARAVKQLSGSEQLGRPTLAVAGKQVLLVEDDRALLLLLSIWLTAAGWIVDRCGSFTEAKQRLATGPPDLLLTDVRLGAFNGLQLVILAKQAAPHTVAVVMSAFDDPMLRREAEASGATLFLVKPFSRTELVTALDDTIADTSRIETI